MPDGLQTTASIARGLEILRAFASDQEWLGNQELAELTGLPLEEVRDSLFQDRDGQLLRVLARAGLTRLHKPIKVALEVAEQTPLDDHDGDWDRRRARMIERIVTQFEGIDADDLSYLLEFVKRPERRGRRGGAADGLH